jgi:signal transduction histidine kinase
MDRMTTPGSHHPVGSPVPPEGLFDGKASTSNRHSLAWAYGKRLRAHWPALVLPALAAELLSMFRFHDHAPWLVLLAVTAGYAVAKPAVAARIAPFALFGYGFLGFLVAHALLTWQHTMIWYGFFMGRAAHASLMFVLPEAFLFLAASLWLLVATGGPGAAAVRRAVQELRGAAGQPKTVPALLLLPVLFLWEEACANPLWYGAGGDANGVARAGAGTWQVLGLAITVGGVFLVLRRPRVAAVVAVLGLIVLGIVLLTTALSGWEEFLLYAQGKIPGEGQAGFYPAAPGVFSGMYGPVALVNQDALWLTKAEGAALIAAGCMLVPRTVAWAADQQLVRRAAALTQRVDRLDRTRSDATSTAVAELRRIERDLHDGAQARLVAVGMSLRAAEQLMPASPEAALALIGEARETSSRALADLRDLVRGIYPPVLADRGLADAVRTLALDTPLTVETDITLSGEPSMPIAAAVYFGIAEILTNAVRHSGADKVEIGIGYAGGQLRATVTDDGGGGADASKGTGLVGVERRLATFDGVLAVSSPPGGPTIVAIEVPCELSNASAARSARFSWPEKTLLGG